MIFNAIIILFQYAPLGGTEKVQLVTGRVSATGKYNVSNGMAAARWVVNLVGLDCGAIHCQVNMVQARNTFYII